MSIYFVFEMEFHSPKAYITDTIRAMAAYQNMSVEVIQSSDAITLIFNQTDKAIDTFLLSLEAVLPASLFLGKSRHGFLTEKPKLTPIKNVKFPYNIAPCPTCQKEMFDISSRRYYYPFTSCNHCGNQRVFVESYPYSRENSFMKFFTPCAGCRTEIEQNPLRKEYPLISCIECGIPLRMVDGKSERMAVEKGEYRKLFEVSANALKKGKTVLLKTMHGYRKFVIPSKEQKLSSTVLLFCDAKALNKHLMMIEQEFNALLSIERPLLRIATKSNVVKNIYGPSVVCKYPDDGLTLLLAHSLVAVGVEYIAYEECEEDTVADFIVDFDTPLHVQKDTRIFINQDVKHFVSGERICYPLAVEKKDCIAVAHGLAYVPNEDIGIIDSMELFGSATASKIYTLEGEAFENHHQNEKIFKQHEASMLSVLAEHHQLGKKAVGVHFDTTLHFLYYNAKNIIDAIPPIDFDATKLWENIATLRDGSQRLVENYKNKKPTIYQRLDALDGTQDIFSVVAIALGLQIENLEGISVEALSFLGKGGLQIDTRILDNRFDNHAFLASILSYQLAGVENSLICYSIYESLGDYIGEMVPQLLEKVGTKTVVLSGESFANQSLYGRIKRTLGRYEPLMSVQVPIGKESAVHGAIYL